MPSGLLILLVAVICGHEPAWASPPTEALINAVQENNEAAIRTLVKDGADVNAMRDAQGESALHFAAWSDAVKPSTLKLLLQLGGKPELVDRQGRTPLVHASLHTDYHVITVGKVKILGPLTKADGPRLEALLSCLQGRETSEVEAVVRYLVDELKVDVNGADASRRTPLMQASSAFFTKSVRLLLGRGANVNARDTQGRTPLLHVLEHYPIIVTGPDENENALDLSREFFATFQALLANKADASVVDQQGRTTIIAYLDGEAVRYTEKHALAVVRALKKAGAAVSVKDKQGQTALDYLPSLQQFLPKQSFAALRQLLR